MSGATLPRQGSLAARVLEHLQQGEPGLVLTSAEIASIFQAKERSVPTCLRPWVKAGLLEHDNDSGYSLPAQEDPADPDAPLQNLRAYEDGDVAFSGCVVDEDGGVLLTKRQLLQLFTFAQSTPLRNAGAKMPPLDIPTFGSGE
jgi:hypothetical protein